MLVISLSREHDARVRSSIAPLQGEARVSAAQVSQLVAGQVVHLLENRGDWWRVRGEDAYEGWMHAGYLEPASGSERTWRVTTGALVRLQDGRLRRLPFGARIPPSADVLEGDACHPAELPVLFPRDGVSIGQTAERRFAGASYLWGGVTPHGCDCSGLVQSVFALHGVRLPRDAWQQAESGRTVPLVSQSLESADLLFFSDRDDQRVTHVAIALGGQRILHSALRRGGVTVEQRGVDDPYVAQLERQLICVQRVI